MNYIGGYFVIIIKSILLISFDVLDLISLMLSNISFLIYNI